MNEHIPFHSEAQIEDAPAQKIIDAIKREHIEPTPRWRTVARNSAFWTMLICMIVLGALFLAVFLSNALDLGPDIFHAFRFERFLSLLILTSPIFWMTLSLVAIASGVFAFRKTRYGYRWSAISLASFFVLTLGLVAFGSHITKIDERFEESWERGGAPFGSLVPPREERWLHPRSGILIGSVSQADNMKFLLNTETGEIWTVFITNDTRISRNVSLISGKPVVVLGEPLENHSFQAFFIRSFRMMRPLPESEFEHER